jgi:hypothetical protein
LLLNLYFAKAYPAIEVKVIYKTVTIEERIKLLKKFVQTFNRSKRTLYCIVVKGSGKNIGGNTLAFPSNINEAPSIQINGMRVITEVMLKKAYNKYFLIIRYSSEF